MTPERYDVIILGGAFSGASAAILLRRELPELRVLVVEKATAFDAKVGEATTEMSAMFLTRRLALWQHLEREHLPKEGLRYWFQNEKVTSHENATEAGGFLRSSVPAFQLRRDVLDEHLLATAVAEGAELMRPARVKEVNLADFDSEVIVESDDATTTLRTRWVLDATGRVTYLGKRLGIIDRNDDHPTASIWGRWTGVRNIDDLAARSGGGLSARNIGSRRLATNHYTGYGYWIWVIPLGNGETSIGIVFDKRLVDLHQSKDREADYIAFMRAIPSLAQLLDGATLRSDDFRFYGQLAYSARQYMGRGWALLGDAASFLDPYYSPGLDHAAFSVEATLGIIKADQQSRPLDSLIREHNETFVRSYHRFFEAAYRDKYFYMGEADLLAASFILDTAHYYIFLVVPAYRFMKKFFWMPVLGPKPAFFSYHLMSLYNRRFKRIALARRERGEGERRNDGRRYKAYFNLNMAPFQMVLRGLKMWAGAEIDLLRLVLTKRKSGVAQRFGSDAPVPATTIEPGR
ncbi:MAG TPA: NAD(P)/FAD-dependent oxidoreductase [Thermoanaerobaculia bacterium]|nr:NAD(P)/FAD-dependent oxidoreductase [Thermoanaerobaculia bacterium]